MKRTYEEAVEISVKWWSEKAFNTPINQNNGDDSDMGGLAFLLMNSVSTKAQERITPEIKQKFEESLTEILLSKKGMARFENQLDVDYHPNENLSKACELAGVDEYCLPCKTFTFIDPETNEVKGRYQYGGEWFKL